MSTVAAHVALVLPVLHPGGAERIAAQLATGLPRHGFQTTVICLEDENAAIASELKQSGIRVVALRKSRFRTLACARALSRQMPTDRPLILHSHLHHANLAARLCLRRLDHARRRSIRIISTVHIVERRLRPWQFMLDRLTAGLADAEVCVSPAVKRFQQRKTRLPDSFFRVIENGIDLSRFTPGESEPRNANSQTRIVLSVGRLDPQKDFPTLLRAWQIVEERLPRARLVIAGNGPQRPRLQRLIAQLRLQRVTLAGFVHDVPALMRQADLYVQPSAWEGFGLTVAEAMACRLPVIVTDVDSLPELVTSGRTGLVIPPRRPGAMAEAILHLLRDTDRAARLAAAARADALARFSLDRMVAQYAGLYHELLRRGDGTGGTPVF